MFTQLTNALCSALWSDEAHAILAGSWLYPTLATFFLLLSLLLPADNVVRKCTKFCVSVGKTCYRFLESLYAAVRPKLIITSKLFLTNMHILYF